MSKRIHFKNKKVLISRLKEKQKGFCAICKKSVDTTETIDHIIPLCLGGSNYSWNLQLVHSKCNSIKNCVEMIIYKALFPQKFPKKQKKVHSKKQKQLKIKVKKKKKPITMEQYRAYTKNRPFTRVYRSYD